MPSGYRAPDALKDEFFSLLRQGMTVTEASVRIGVWRSNTQRWLGKTGGMRMRKSVEGGIEAGPVPAAGPGSNRLDLVDRAVIMIRVREGARVAAIAREIGRNRSVVWREIRRNRSAEKGTDLSVFTAEDLDTIADKFNNLPRPTLDLETPKQRMRQLIATAA